MIGATALGAGTPAFAAAVPRLRLIGSRRREGSDNVLLSYEVAREDARS